jgi:hypothetical protein
MKGQIRIEITEVAKKHIASHNVRAEEILTILERDYFVKKESEILNDEESENKIIGRF